MLLRSVKCGQYKGLEDVVKISLVACPKIEANEIASDITKKSRPIEKTAL